MLGLTNTAMNVVVSAMVAIFTPPAQVTPSEWAAKNLVVPDGPRAGKLWDPKFTPYIVEPLDNMGPESPVNRQAVRKSAQTGFTMMAIAGTGHSIDVDPIGGLLMVQPTKDALDKFLRDKFNPTVEQSKSLARKVAPQISRSGEGSTAYNKRYPGGSAAFVIANSAAALRSMTKRRVIKDEASEYPADLEGQGSPHAMIEARRLSFIASGDWKETSISTPTVVGACYIDEAYKAGDQRRWHVDCPGCGEPFVFAFGKHFRFTESFPFEAHYVAPCCGTVIEHAQKNELVRMGSARAPVNAFLDRLGLRNGWIATQPGPGRYPSYHFDALSSPVTTWDYIAEKYIEARTSSGALQGFYNLVLGEAYEVRGDAPDHERLFERREDYRKLHIPDRGLMLTAFADVQMRGIYYEVVAWAPNRESWVVDADVIAGDTVDPHAGAFAALDEIYRREYVDAFGGRRGVDAFGVDSGFRSHVVYEWCRTRHKAYATKGVEGWARPALGMPSLQDVDLDGRRVTHGVRLWPIGNWPLKGHWYEDLRRVQTNGVFPAGYCHFGRFLDTNYFRQITAEYLVPSSDRRYRSKPWQIRGKEDNHWLDCRIGNMALADHLGVSRMTEEEWKVLARERAAPLLDQGDMFAPKPIAVSQSVAAAERAAPSATAVQSDDQPQRQASGFSDEWIGRDTSDWFNRG